MTPDVHFRQNPDGSLVAGEIFSGDLDHEEDAACACGSCHRADRAKIAGPARGAIGTSETGQRPVPLDGLPVVGAVPDAPGFLWRSCTAA